jgi:2-amino-4-hydroxy-6-hydroxymethyldihydropteridine diphosphokinase
MRIGIALGSNLGDRLKNLQKARAAVVQLPGVAQPILSSSVYSTSPVDCEAGARDFLNAVVEIGYEDDPRSLLPQMKKIENSLGRTPGSARNVSRAIDLDFLYAGALQIDDKKLHVPHPRMHDRRFVLQPLADIRPELILPGQEKPVSEVLASLPQVDKVERLTEDW